MSLSDWSSNGWLAEHQTTREEIAALLALSDRDLRDAKKGRLSTDWQFNIAYNAALQVALAALAASGYRPARGGPHHHYAIQSLAFTLSVDSNTIRLLDRFRKKRNAAEYDQVGAVSGQEVKEMLELATELRQQIRLWLSENHPSLT